MRGYARLFNSIWDLLQWLDKAPCKIKIPKVQTTYYGGALLWVIGPDAPEFFEEFHLYDIFSDGSWRCLVR